MKKQLLFTHLFNVNMVGGLGKLWIKIINICHINNEFSCSILVWI